MKVYVKPELYYESFELSQNVATCDYQLSSNDKNSCKIITDRYENDGGNWTGGFSNTKVCDFEYEVYCYTDGSGTMPSLFKS